MHNSDAVKIIHYACPVAVFLFFVLSRLLVFSWKAGVQRTGARKTAKRKIRRDVKLKYLAFGVLLLYIAQTVSVTVYAFKVHDTAPDEIIYMVSSILIWLWISTEGILPWYTYAGCAFSTGLLNVGLLALSVTIPFTYVFGALDFALQLSLVVASGCMIVLSLISSFGEGHKLDEETEPLLASATTTTPAENDDDDAYQSQDDEDNKSATWNDKFRDHMSEDSASWWDYLMAFKTFLPYLIPKRDIRVQICLAIFIGCLSAQRVLNLLIPRQLGIITNQLSENANGSTHTAPLAALWIYLFLKYLPLSLIKYVVRYPLVLFTYKKIHCAAFDHVMSLDVDFHDDEDHSRIYTAIRQGSSIQDLLLLFVETIIPSIIDLSVAFFYLGHLFDLYVSYVFFVSAICYCICKSKTTNWNRPLRRQFSKKYRDETQVLLEAISGWRNVVYFNQFDYESKRYKSAVEDFTNIEQRFAFRQSIASSIVQIIVALAFGVVSTLVVILISQHKAPVGSFVILFTYWASCWSPLDRMSESYQHINYLLIDAERLLWLFQLKPVVTESATAKDLVITNASVEYQDVGFSYDPRKESLAAISFHATGGTTALVGETGGGKSTIFKLLQRLYDVSQGSIKIDGQDLRDVTLDSLRNSIGIVPQDPFLFDISIMKNIRYGRLDATDEEVYDACRVASIHDKLLSFPDGYDSKCGQRGVKLSGGELQRIAIARCLLKDPKILLLDEASSAVDSQTEAQIQQALQKLTVGRTTFVIAHRLSTIINADQILVIESGRIIESGTHNELLKKGTKYHKLWSMQALGLQSTDQNENTLLDTPIEPHSEVNTGTSTSRLEKPEEMYAILERSKEVGVFDLSDVEERIEKEIEIPELASSDGALLDQSIGKGKGKVLTEEVVQPSGAAAPEQVSTENPDSLANVDDISKGRSRRQRRKHSRSDPPHLVAGQAFNMSGATDEQSSSGTTAPSRQQGSGSAPSTQQRRGGSWTRRFGQGSRRAGGYRTTRSEAEAESSSTLNVQPTVDSTSSSKESADRK